MIDITPYQQKLEWLKEWMQFQIEQRHRIDQVITDYIVKRRVYFGDRYNGEYEHELAGNFDDYCRYKKYVNLRKVTYLYGYQNKTIK